MSTPNGSRKQSNSNRATHGSIQGSGRTVSGHGNRQFNAALGGQGIQPRPAPPPHGTKRRLEHSGSAPPRACDRPKRAANKPPPRESPVLSGDGEDSSWHSGDGEADGKEDAESSEDGSSSKASMTSSEGGRDRAAHREVANATKRNMSPPRPKAKKPRDLSVAELEEMLASRRREEGVSRNAPHGGSTVEPTGSPIGRPSPPPAMGRLPGDVRKLRRAAQAWVNNEIRAGRLDGSKKWDHQEGVGDPDSLIARRCTAMAGSQGAEVPIFTSLVRTFMESR